jgi:hypothetical protein
MDSLNKVVRVLASAVVVAGVACTVLSGCTKAEGAAIAADLEATASQVLSDILAGKGYVQILADVGSGGASLLVTVIEYAESDPNLSAADQAKVKAAAAPYLAQAKAEVAAHAR